MTLSYDTAIPQAKALILDVVNQNQAVLQNPKPVVVVKELTETGIKIAIRAWVKTSEYCPKILKKMSRDTLANPRPPPCDRWWRSDTPPPRSWGGVLG